jgi:hypothetical protein
MAIENFRLQQKEQKDLLGLYVKHPIFLPDFNRICILSKDSHKIPQYQISRTSVRCQPR